VSVDELVDESSQQFDVSSFYDDDAEQQQLAATSSKRFAEQLSAKSLHVVQHSRFPKKCRQLRDVGGYSFR